MAGRKPHRRSTKGIDWELTPLQREFAGLLLIAVSLITLLGLLSLSHGVLIDGWVRGLRLLLGWGAYPAAIGLGTAGGTFFIKSLRRQSGVNWPVVIGWEVAFVALLAFLHLISFPTDPRGLADEGGGGGWVGWALSSLLITGMGPLVAVLISLVIGGVGLGLAQQISWNQVREGVLGLSEVLVRGFRVLQRRWNSASSPSISMTSRDPTPPISTDARSNQQGEMVTRPSLRRGRHRATIQPKALLPPLDLLYDLPSVTFSEVEIQRRVRTIEETLTSFGVPAKVVDVKTGPVVTQFGVEPGFVVLRSGERRKVRVSKIASLRKDLALALAASPIRVQAPVPGRRVVGIEVPNGQTSMVSLRGVMESAAFEKIDSLLCIALGRDVSGMPIATDLGAMPHLLIAGATGSGKSKCIDAIITSLLFQNSPRTLKLLMVDPKRVELLRYNGLPHLISPVETDMVRVVGILKWLTRHMDGRYQRFADMGVRHIEEFNRRAATKGEEVMPYVVLVIDELADLMMTAPDETEPLICRLAQLARATGIHLVLATQRPSVDVVTGLIKANFSARVAFAVTSQVDSRVIVDTTGAEALLGSGDMLFMAPDSAELVRIQGCFVSDEEIESVVRFWKMSLPEEIPASDNLPWEEVEETNTDLDPLIKEAIRIVQERSRASASFLQRRMHIGYPRAARLIDQMEELGVVGPARDHGQSREVLDKVDAGTDAPMLSLGTSDN